MADRGEEFASIAHRIFVTERRFSLEQVAAKMGLTYDALYARLRNRIRFTADEIRLLLAAAPDGRLVSYLLRDSPFVAAERIDPGLDDEEEQVLRATHRIVVEATDVLEAVDTALRDHKIDHRDARLINDEIEVAERALVSLRKRIEAFL